MTSSPRSAPGVQLEAVDRPERAGDEARGDGSPQQRERDVNRLTGSSLHRAGSTIRAFAHQNNPTIPRMFAGYRPPAMAPR